MKAVRNSLVLVAASVVVMSGVAQEQDKSVLFHQEALTNSIANFTLDMKTEPQFVLGSNTRLSGLLVDCVTPSQTWMMLNPSLPVRDLTKPLPPSQLPVKAPLPIHNHLDLAVHEPDFALLRLSFP